MVVEVLQTRWETRGVTGCRHKAHLQACDSRLESRAGEHADHVIERAQGRQIESLRVAGMPVGHVRRGRVNPHDGEVHPAG